MTPSSFWPQEAAGGSLFLISPGEPAGGPPLPDPSDDSRTVTICAGSSFPDLRARGTHPCKERKDGAPVIFQHVVPKK
jgi:hypothetical protein